MNPIRRAVGEDIPGMVRVHLASFPNFFLTFMGPRFLELLYREIAREPGNVSLVSVAEDGRIIGFAVGVGNQVGLYKRLASKRWVAFALASLRSAIRNPFVIPRLLRAFNYPSLASAASCPGLLMSIAVDPGAKGRGVGKDLVRRFLLEMRTMGIDRVCLTTDRDDNEHTNGFYRRCGFTLAREFRTPEGRWMNEFVIAIDDAVK